MLEDLCLKSIETTHGYQCVKQFIDCCCKEKKLKIKNISKAKVQAYLAIKSPIVNSLGTGAQKGYWDFDHRCFEDIKKFLNDLFRNVNETTSTNRRSSLV